MARIKNALTGYFVATPVTEPATASYLELAKWISDVSDDTDESTDDTGYYDGDGTLTTDVTSISERYTFEGFYDAEDPAMKLIAGLKREIGEGRKVLFKKVEADGEESAGIATVTDIVASGGAATDYATFGCAITWDKKPTVTPATP
jgi:hypothetical protein